MGVARRDSDHRWKSGRKFQCTVCVGAPAFYCSHKQKCTCVVKTTDNLRRCRESCGYACLAEVVVAPANDHLLLISYAGVTVAGVHAQDLPKVARHWRLLRRHRTPTANEFCLENGAQVKTTGTELKHATKVSGWRRATAVTSPAPDICVSGNHAGSYAAGFNVFRGGKIRRHQCFPAAIVSPTDDRTTLKKGAGMVHPCSYPLDAGYGGRVGWFAAAHNCRELH